MSCADVGSITPDLCMSNAGRSHPASWRRSTISVLSRGSAASRRDDPAIAFQQQLLATPNVDTKEKRVSRNGHILAETGTISGSDVDRPGPGFASLVQRSRVGDRS